MNADGVFFSCYFSILLVGSYLPLLNLFYQFLLHFIETLPGSREDLFCLEDRNQTCSFEEALYDNRCSNITFQKICKEKHNLAHVPLQSCFVLNKRDDNDSTRQIKSRNPPLVSPPIHAGDATAVSVCLRQDGERPGAKAELNKVTSHHSRALTQTFQPPLLSFTGRTEAKNKPIYVNSSKLVSHAVKKLQTKTSEDLKLKFMLQSKVPQ